MSEFSVRLAGADLTFSAAHFITLSGGICEPLHGHDYRVAAELAGPLDENQYVIDFLVLQQELKTLLADLDHSVLLPTGHPAIQVAEQGAEVEARFAERRWVFPRAECRLLPMVNTTAELLAQHIARRLLDVLAARHAIHPRRIRIEVEETPGCWAAAEIVA